VECAKCTNPPDVAQNCNNIPRGGHSVVAPAPRDLLADAAANTAAAFVELTPYGIPLTGWKVIFQIILTAINVFCWLVPLRSKKMSENKFALSLANAFSGGVFLSLAFGHLIPECIHGFEGFNEVTPYMLVLGGYLLIFFFEKVAFDAHDILHEMEHSYEKANGASNKNDHSVDGEKAVGPHSSGRSAQILLGALAIHSILEMMALGLADSFGDCALLTLSIALHQVNYFDKLQIVATWLSLTLNYFVASPRSPSHY
jgi:zinc transporter 1/2/3